MEDSPGQGMTQIDRTRRYLKRLRDIYTGVPYIEETREYYVDDVLSFFIHCHHIGDWIENTNKVGITRDHLLAFIRAHPELRICADLCNQTKHCRLTSKWTDGTHLVSRTFESSGRNGVIHTTKGKFTVHSEGKFFDALDLAESCLRLWDEFVNQLIPAKAADIERQ